MSQGVPPREAMEGAVRFARRSFHAAHEDFETAWRRARGDERLVLQALVQVAAAFHHLDRGRMRQTRVLLERAMAKLEGDPAVGWIDVEALRGSLERALAELSRGAAPAAPDLQSLLSGP